MTQYLNSIVYDHGLIYLINNCNRLCVLSAEPADYADVAVRLLGNKDAPVIAGPLASGNGRKVTVLAITDGTVVATGSITYYALVNDNLEMILTYGQVLFPKAVVDGNAFTFPPLDIIMPGVV